MTSLTAQADTCVLIAEITGDNPLLDKLGPIETEHAVERSRKRAERAIDAYQGKAVTTAGRRLVAHFARAEQAVQAAFDMRARVKQLPPVSGVALSVHVVLHHKPAGSDAATVLDQAVRYIAACPANQIQVSGATLAILPEAVRQGLQGNGTPVGEDSLYGFVEGFGLGGVPATPANSAESFSPTATSLGFNAPSLEDAVLASAELPRREQARTSLLLRHHQSNLSVSSLHPVILAGREEGNDLVIAERRASRHHARIEYRQQRYWLVDTSTNGTFLIDEKNEEIELRRGEAELTGRGRIGFGYSPNEAGAEVVFFDVTQG